VLVAVLAAPERAGPKCSDDCSGLFRWWRTARDQPLHPEHRGCSGCSGIEGVRRRCSGGAGGNPGPGLGVEGWFRRGSPANGSSIRNRVAAAIPAGVRADGSSGAAAVLPSTPGRSQALDVPGVVRATRRGRRASGTAVGSTGRFARRIVAVPSTKLGHPTVDTMVGADYKQPAPTRGFFIGCAGKDPWIRRRSFRWLQGIH